MEESRSSHDDSSESQMSRRSVLRGATAAGIAGTGVLAGVSGSARANCGGNLGSSSGYDCSQDPWQEGGSDDWDNCGSRAAQDPYEGYDNNFSVSWLGTKDNDRHYFGISAGAHSYRVKYTKAQDACDGNVDLSDMRGGFHVNKAGFRVDLSEAEETTSVSMEQDLVGVAAMDGGEWMDWVDRNGGEKADKCDIKNEWENKFLDDDFPSWVSAASIGVATAAGYFICPPAGAAVSTLTLLADLAGDSQCDITKNNGDESYEEREWRCDSSASMAYAGEFYVEMDGTQTSDVHLEITQYFETNRVDDSTNKGMTHEIVIPADGSCDPYVLSSSMN